MVAKQGSSRATDGTEPSYYNPSSLDASLAENTHRTGDTTDPLDQHHQLISGRMAATTVDPRYQHDPFMRNDSFNN